MKKLRIAVLGAGGREAALAWKLGMSPYCLSLERWLDASSSFEEIATFVEKKGIDLLLIGPEAPLVGGIVDFFHQRGLSKDLYVLAPSKAAAQLEGSKKWAKDFMRRHQIPTPEGKDFSRDSYAEGLRFLEAQSSPYVLKASGLAQGKGVLLTESLEEAKQILHDMLFAQKFGTAGEEVLIESFLGGRELSCFLFVAGSSYTMLPWAADYKRLKEQNRGDNTGGMGAVSPVPWVTKRLKTRIQERIIDPTLRGLSQEKIPYHGFLFIGLMCSGEDPYVLEYNVRLGDPETQCILPRIQTDLVPFLWKTYKEGLPEEPLKLNNQSCLTLSMVSGGYPRKYEVGKKILGLDQIPKGVELFPAGMRKHGNEWLSAGGRVLNLSALGKDLAQAQKKVYEAAQKIRWENLYYRRDIGDDLLADEV
ncbi:MAG: phosphoribosylamine--glycine ligase [Cytophagales bacterium]|nr:phosphoribosylamine--glycine ligase [Cytophagales bacterium]